MGNKKIRAYYDGVAKAISDPKETRNKSPDFSRYDIAYMQDFADPAHSLLDLGAGSGLLLNHIKDGFKSVVAVELYESFSNFITPAANTTIINQDILKFDTTETFDVVIAFGVMNFFDAAEAQSLYKKIHKFTAQGGKFIIKNQMGVDADVIVDRFSEELQQNYYSEYRTAQHEQRLLENAGFTVSRVDDLYPDAFNRWPDTRFMAIVSEKPAQ